MRILGIDPGYAIVGWGVVDFSESSDSSPNGIKLIDCGVITTPAGLDLADRLLELHNDILEIIKEYKPQLVGMETLLFQTNTTTAMAVAEARGVLTLAARQSGVGVCAVTPSQVKSSIAGYGKADKRQVQENVRMLCGLEEIPKPDDAADAVAVAIAAEAICKSPEAKI